MLAGSSTPRNPRSTAFNSVLKSLWRSLVHFRHTRQRWVGPALVLAVGAASLAVAYMRVESYDLQPQAQPPTATAVTPLSASDAWAAASRASGTR